MAFHYSTFTLILKISKIVEVIFQIKGLRIWKMQLLDEEHILIKYASEEVVTLRSSEPNAQVNEKFV
jgi:de-etiolated-1